MLIILVAVFLVLAMAFFDRQRGTPKSAELMPKALALLGLGLVVVTIILPPAPWQALALLAGTWAAYSIGFGAPLGWAITGYNPFPGAWREVWQVGGLRYRPWLSLFVRGLFHAVPGLLIGDPRAALVLAAAFGIAFPLAPWLATRVFKRAGDEAWALNEYLRGGIAAAILCGAYLGARV